MEKLPNWNLPNTYPAFYDGETVSVLDKVAKLYGAMNGLIEEQNQFTEKYKNTLSEFLTEFNKHNQEFETGVLQKFQDFTDVVELHIKKQQKRIEDAEKYMRDNIIETTQNVLENLLKGESITIKEFYDESTESVSVVFSAE